MKEAKWLIEKNVFEDNEKQLVEEIKKQGMKVNLIEDSHREDIVKHCVNFLYEPQDCVVFYGSLGVGRKLKKTPWIPGVYLNEKAFECTSYYPVLGNMLVHSHYIMLPFGDLLRLKDWLFDCAFLHVDKLFMRPNSGMKQFTGMVVTKEGFEEGVNLASFYDIDPDMLVLVSNVWALHREWRFVVVDGKVISGSAYRDWSYGENLDISTNDYVLQKSHSIKVECFENTVTQWDTNAWNAAQQCADRYNPDRCWTIDVARTTAGTYAILEIGCFSCAGLYGANIEKVVKAVSESAIKEWEEYNI
jgi:hypothetical protein